jgi:UDP-2,3-diacylglucosamine pyrophosphatase LpxH
VRTLVVSDLHLANRARHDALRLPVIRERLIDAIGRADRLVLLGDTVELVHRHPRRSLAVAEPVMRALGRALGPERDVIIVPGNHDAPLLRAWALAQGADLQTSSAVPVTASPALQRVVGWLAPARVRVSYPGVWLGDRIWATHGHYLDHHLLPDSAFGVLRPPRRDPMAGATMPIDYEQMHLRSRRSREPFAARLMARPVATVLQSAADAARIVPRMMLNSRMSPLTARLLDVQMRRAAIPAMARVVTRLRIDADWVLFGHVHRRGPVGDEPWPSPSASAGGVRFVNTGAWMYEPLLVDRGVPPHPYWPGGAVLLDGDEPPRSLGLLDDLGAEELRAMFSVG